MSAPIDVLIVDWRENQAALPRYWGRYYERRAKAKSDEEAIAAITGMLVHNTGGMESIEQDNYYHAMQADWDASEYGVQHAPHIAYTLWAPKFPIDWLNERGIAYDRESPPKAVLVICNHYWERSWHGTRANDSCLGFAFQGDGVKSEASAAQWLALDYALDVLLPSEGIVIPRSRVWGHGECPKVYGGGPDWVNVTLCPGEYILRRIRQIREGV